MKILVTGSCGLIGRCLMKTLKEQGHTLYAVDNLSTSRAPIPEVAYGDYFFEGTVEEFVSFAINPDGYDFIYHLASPVGPVAVLKHAGKMSLNILEDLSLMADLAIENDCPLVEISTSEVFGQTPIGSQSEDIDKIVTSNYTVRQEYGVSKLLGEIMLSNIAKVKPLKYFEIRPFNIVGAGQNADSGFVLPRFIQQALNGAPLTVYGDGSDLRTFTAVQDFVDAIVLLLDCKQYGTTFNIGNPNNQITIGELARKVLKEIPGELVFIDPKTLHGKNFEGAWNKIADISRAKSLLGWYPNIDLDTIIHEVVEYEKSNFNAIS